MATEPDLESLNKQHDKLVKEVEELREKAADEERKLLERQQAESVKVDVSVLEAEKARLQARLESAKEAAKAYTDAKSPVEQAQEAVADEAAAATVQASTDEKKGQ